MLNLKFRSHHGKIESSLDRNNSTALSDNQEIAQTLNIQSLDTPNIENNKSPRYNRDNNNEESTNSSILKKNDEENKLDDGVSSTGSENSMVSLHLNILTYTYML